MRLTLRPWDEVETLQLAGAFVVFGLIVVLHVAGVPGWTGLLDDANLAFHEAGHVGYGMLGETLGLYGGVLGQLTIPAMLAAGGWWRREPVVAAGGALWWFENLPNIGRYMADARAQELPLAGGGEHDFTNIFTRWDVLDADTTIGAGVIWAGWLGMGATLAWLVWRWDATRRAHEVS